MDSVATGGSFEPIAAFAGAGAVVYTPQRAPALCGFGLWEVHPNKVSVTREGVVSLEWNGEYLAVGELDGQPYRLACCGVPEQMSARDLAERVCAFRNEGQPTRVVDACGGESISKHTAASVQAELNEAQASCSEL